MISLCHMDEVPIERLNSNTLKGARVFKSDSSRHTIDVEKEKT